MTVILQNRDVCLDPEPLRNLDSTREDDLTSQNRLRRHVFMSVDTHFCFFFLAKTAAHMQTHTNTNTYTETSFLSHLHIYTFLILITHFESTP